MQIKNIRLATRHSLLAKWQAEHVRTALRTKHPHLQVELLPMTTAGDANHQQPLYQIGGKGLFVKRLEQALLAGEADLAVHSMKDVPNTLADDFCIAAIMQRADSRDALLSVRHLSLADLPAGATLATTSLRRRSQLLHARSDIQCPPLRGNIDTRIKRLDEGKYDAIVLACAGLQRLGYQKRITQVLPTALCLPAAGQGAIGVECLTKRKDIQTLIQPLNDQMSADGVLAERALCRALNADCYSPLAVAAKAKESGLTLQAVLGDTNGQHLIRAEAHAPSAELAVHQVAQSLMQQGSQQILADSRAWCHKDS